MKTKQYNFFVLLFLPVLLKYLFICFFSDFYYVEEGDLKEDILFCVSILVLYYGIAHKKQVLFDLLCFVYVFYFVLEATSYIAVSSNFSSSYMFLLIESNKEELKEFTTSYITVPIVIFVILMGAFFFIFRKTKTSILKLSKKFMIGTLIFFGIVAFLKGTGLIESNAYHNIVRGVYGYFELQNSVKFNNDISSEDVKITSDNEVLVVVLGESTTSKHMQLYGYERETTPLLNLIKDSLYIYNDVVSSDVITTKSVPKILSSVDNNKEVFSTNIIEVFNNAEYRTLWLSNQRPIGFYDNLISEIASVSNYLKFFNHLNEVKTNIYDEILLPEFINVLNQEGKKLIILRLIGTHFDYRKRYPETYNKFKNSENATKRERIINSYDNAVLYNDFIVYSFIKELQKINKKSALLYLSDHGENVYHESTDFFGRSETVLTRSMFDIPFLLWTSKDFEFPEDFTYKPNRKFVADHTYESIGHIFGVKYKDMDFTKSIFSKSFIERKRIVVNGTNYDVFFK